MAAWVPYWGNDLASAGEMFEEALVVARSDPAGDAWAEARALVGLGAIASPQGDEREALALAEEALRIGDESGQAFTTAVAHENLGASLRRMLRLDESIDHENAAIQTFRELGARWELASGLGDRGAVHRLAGRLEEGEQDLREAFRLCRELGERALVTWTAAELARSLVARGDLGGARQVLDDVSLRAASREQRWSYPALLTAESAFALAEGDDAGGLAKALAAIEEERSQHGEGGNALAAQVWWAGRLFGEDAAGGAAIVGAARERLERHAWLQALREPELVGEQLGR
jgi:tetratricopeptide (TPR) repeat protein